jgi:hypothetical protein
MIGMKLLTINKNDDIDTINQANIFDKLIDNGYMDENKNVLKEFEIHVNENIIAKEEDITKHVPLPIKLSLQEQVKKPNGKIKIRCTWLEALRWQEFKENPNTRGL